MTRANVARRQGDDFQARLFWLIAAWSSRSAERRSSALPTRPGPKSFDDILVEYDSARPPSIMMGSPLVRRHIQSKWHTRAGVFGYPTS